MLNFQTLTKLLVEYCNYFLKYDKRNDIGLKKLSISENILNGQSFKNDNKK